MLLASVPRGLFFEIATPDLFQPVREVPEFTTNPKVCRARSTNLPARGAITWRGSLSTAGIIHSSNA